MQPEHRSIGWELGLALVAFTASLIALLLCGCSLL